ncbi:DUF6396 domain-containing protein [Conservatibacter flavescens]|uniref:DUF6396 domain-containing protein n=1 Tax=Conservatibacter flavescens TaxID=28161 RepID=A0A2M8S0T1_9PAST|nr:DUF6396 domain-containing protein [Conservatibacter flavescens]PJG84706.1 hypothetical protein CVP05_09920 [Conservatibacter flavescens]
MNKLAYCIGILLFSVGCSTASSPQNTNVKEELINNLDIACVHEKRPPLSPETQQLYQYAHYHDLHNMWLGKKGDNTWQSMAVYYRIAAYNGDYKANQRLQYLLKSGRVVVKNPQDEVYYLNKALEKQLPATAYYNLYEYLGSKYGVTTKEKGGKYAYLRQAAEMGSRDAQYVIAEIILGFFDKETLKRRIEIAHRLLACASEQGLGQASADLGIDLKIQKKYPDAIKVFYQGTKNGNALSARKLMRSFKQKIEPSDRVNYLALDPDPERGIRFEMIAKYLSRNYYLLPTVPDLDEIVPLPPAKLPAWDGKIAFQRWYEGASPPKPSEELMQKLADQAGLDVNTGLPKK